MEEACCNVIEHAYDGRGGQFVICFASPTSADIEITVHDHGRPFRSAARSLRPNVDLPLEERPIGGLGLHLMYQLMDEVQFSFSADGNTLVMVKRDAVPVKERGCAESPATQGLRAASVTVRRTAVGLRIARPSSRHSPKSAAPSCRRSSTRTSCAS